MKYRTVLSVPHGNIGKLAALCGCSTKYASQCLQGAYNTEKADMVRSNAIKYFRAYETKIPTYITK